MSWFHSGSAAFGSLLVAILQFIRWGPLETAQNILQHICQTPFVKYMMPTCCFEHSPAGHTSE